MSQNCPDVTARVGQLNTVLPRFQGLVSGNEESIQLAASMPTSQTASTALPSGSSSMERSL
ncbi:hypothetical protein ACFVKB_44610 [Rhodococcus sp. NPDC127530]|uniref:hypothetical protein n=1 Tax=unclassified Rhodococcus (in: high G+C Gram-positive bacteria) TaxID=192944 RepID=UPI0036276E12